MFSAIITRVVSISLILSLAFVYFSARPLAAGNEGGQQSARTPVYSVTDLGKLVGRQSSLGLGLNKHGHIVGRSGAAQSGGQAFIWRDGQLDNLGTLPGGEYSQAMDINDKDEVVGWSNTAVTTLAFYWRKGTMESLGTLPGDASSQALGINDRGMVVGFSSGAAGTRPFLWTEKTGMIDLQAIFGGEAGVARGINNLGLLIGTSKKGGRKRALFSDGVTASDLKDEESLAFGINDSGEIVGRLGGITNGRAFRWNPREGVLELGTLPGHDFSEALHTNNSGQVVGSSRGAGGNRAFIWTKDRGMRDLNELIPPIKGVVLSVATKINDRGQIIAYNDTLDAPTQAYLLTPGQGEPGFTPAADAEEHVHGEKAPTKTP